MKKYFCNYEQSLALKESGFNEFCFATFDEDKWFEIQDFEQNYDTFPSHIISAPLKSQVFEWFRKEKDLYCEIRTFVWDYDKKELGFSIRTYLNPIDIETERLIHSEVYKTYEEAESACIDKLIELLK